MRAAIACSRGRGLSITGITKHLNDQGHAAHTGKPWNPMHVSRVLERAETA